VLDLCEVMAEAIEMVRNDCESTPVSRARALAYCCGVDAKLIEMAAISERQQPEQSEDAEIKLDAEYDEAEGFLIQTDPDTHDDYLKWFVYDVRLAHNRDAESEAAFQAATSDLITKASKEDSVLVRIYTDALRVQYLIIEQPLASL
jgi:hypothetical protein